MTIPSDPRGSVRAVHVPIDHVTLDGDLAVPAGATGVVLFAHGSGSSRLSPRNRAVAAELRAAGLATLLLDLLTPAEGRADEATGRLRFDIPLLATRLAAATDWVVAQPETRHLPVGYFGASTGAGAALIAAANRPGVVRAVVSRGGRPDLAGAALAGVRAPTLLVVGGEDTEVIALNRAALARLQGPKRLSIVAGATHLFEEPGALEQVTRLAREWLVQHLAETPAAARGSFAAW
jgi:putative phosphoribosyl transferase